MDYYWCYISPAVSLARKLSFFPLSDACTMSRALFLGTDFFVRQLNYTLPN